MKRQKSIASGITLKVIGRAMLMGVCLWGAACANNGGNGTYSAEPVKTTASEEQDSSGMAHRQNGRNRATSPRAAGKLGAGNVSKELQSELRFDFAENVSLSHLRSSGLLLDFGTDSRNKYTVGDWKTGWRGNYTVNGATISYVEGRAARLYFHLNEEEAGDGRLVIRARGVGQKSNGRLYLNGEGLGPIEFQSTFSHATIEVKGKFKPGNNELMLRPGEGAKAEDGKFARLAVDYVRVIPDGTDERQAASAISSVVTQSHGGETSALRLREGDRLTWYVPVPKDGFIHAEVRSIGEAKDSGVTLAVQKSGMARKNVFSLDVDARGQTVSTPIAECGDDVCAVDVQVTKGEVLFESLQLRLPVQARPKASGRRAATNVALVLIDTLRADHLSVYNPETRVRTPFIDALAKESMVFETAWAQENWTKPSVTSLLSGLYSATHQNKSESNKVPQSVAMIQEHLSKLGFETAGFVANGYVSGKFGFRRGWDKWTNYVREGKRNRAQFVADDAVDWLKGRKDEKPFFLYVHTIDPHVPYIPPAKYRAMYDNEPYNGVVEAAQTASVLEKVKTGALRLSERDQFRLEALYDGEISYHDDHLIRVYDELKAQGLLENTLIVVTADHGEEFFEHGSVGHGHSLYEELLHVPLLVRLPGAKAKDAPLRFSENVELVDVVPTICELTGVQFPKGLQGRSLVPQLDGREPNWPNAVFSEFMDGQITARTSRYKLIYRGLSTTLFDLAQDRLETTDLSDERPEAFVMMRDALGMHMGEFAAAGVLSGSAKSGVSAPAEKSTVKPANVHKREDAVIDRETRKQLEALGYMGD